MNARVNVCLMVCIMAYLMLISFRSDNEVRAPVLDVRVLVVTGLERKFLAVAHGAESIGGDAERHQIRAGCDSPPFAQCQIVLGGSALVAVSFNRDGPAGVFFQDEGVGIEDPHGVSRELAAVVLEEHRLER